MSLPVIPPGYREEPDTRVLTVQSVDRVRARQVTAKASAGAGGGDTHTGRRIASWHKSRGSVACELRLHLPARCA